MKTLSGADSERTVTISPGEEVSIALDENPTTGFRWTVESVSGAIAVLGSDFDAPPQSQPGAGGRRTVRLRAGDTGAGELQMRYDRPGAESSESATRTRFRFAVRPA